MKLSDVMSAMHVSVFAQVPLLVFFGIFIGVVLHLMQGKSAFEHARQTAARRRKVRGRQRAMSAPSEHPLPAARSAPPERDYERAPEAPVLDHEYDGIREYDNPLPRWWVWMWAGSFFFSVGYFFHYHVSHNGTSVSDDYVAGHGGSPRGEKPSNRSPNR